MRPNLLRTKIFAPYIGGVAETDRACTVLAQGMLGLPRREFHLLPLAMPGIPSAQGGRFDAGLRSPDPRGSWSATARFLSPALDAGYSARKPQGMGFCGLFPCLAALSFSPKSLAPYIGDVAVVTGPTQS